MCGIVGVMAQNPGKSTTNLFRMLLAHSGVRGLHASGVYCDGTLIKLESGAPELAAQQLPQSKLMLGHARYSTSGDYHAEVNTQPLKLGKLVLAHNGIVSMSDNFGAEFGEKCVTTNDSEVILRKVHRHSLKQNLARAIAISVEELAQVQRPVFACVMVDESDNRVYLFRDDVRPLHLWFVPQLCCYAWTSTRDIMQRACPYEYDEVLFQDFSVVSIHADLSFTNDDVINLKPLPVVDFSTTTTLIKLTKPATSIECTRDVDYRLSRRQAFIDYYASIILTWDVDPAYPLMKYLIDRYELSREQQYWMMWLYGVFYHVASVHWVMQEFPDFHLVDLRRLQKWHDENWQLLQYETDRRHEKGLFIDRFKSYQEWVGDQTQDAKFNSLLDWDDLGTALNPYTSYVNVTKEASKLRGFGRYALFYYTEALARCVGLPILCNKIPLETCDSSRNGLAHALKREDLVDCLSLTKQDYQFLYWEQEKLMDEIKHCHPELPVDFWYMETAECAFKGLFRRRRYIGYYIDRLYEEIVSIEHKDKTGVTQGVCWSVLEEFREEHLDSRYINHDGINQAALHSMIDDGELALLHPGALDSEEVLDVTVRSEVNCEIRDSNRYKPASESRVKDTAKLAYLNYRILECSTSKQIYDVVKARPLKRGK